MYGFSGHEDPKNMALVYDERPILSMVPFHEKAPHPSDAGPGPSTFVQG
jgi:hypothetical protein